MRQDMKGSIVFGTILALGVTPLGANDSQSVSVRITVPAIFSVETSAASVAIAFAEADYDAARTASRSVPSAHHLLVRSNRPWVVAFKSTMSTFSFIPARDGADPGKPSTALSVRTGGAPFAPVTTSDQVLNSGSAGPVVAPGNTFPVDYRMGSDLNTDRPGLYTLTLTYTVTSP
jgi:hypothetical protein